MTPFGERPFAGSTGSGQSLSLLCVMKDDSKGEALAGANGADAVAHGHSIDTASAALRAMIHGEENGISLMQRDDRDAGLHAPDAVRSARTLLR